MRYTLRSALLATVATVGLALPAAAQQGGNGLITDLLNDIGQVQQKLSSLGQAIPADKWGWRPGQGVRSVGEVIRHVASDNYLLPTALGTMAPAATGIKGDDFGTVQAYEAKQATKEASLAELEASFAHLKTALQGTSVMGDEISMFGQKFSRRAFLILVTTHLHEHLGQLIAYARTNGVVPPWSRGGM